MSNVLRERGGLVDSLASCLQHGAEDLKNLPDLLKRVIREDAWRERVIPQTGEKTEPFRSFVEFVSTDPLEGLGADVRTLRNLCRDDPEALDELDKVTEGKQGERTDLVSNIHEVNARPAGTTETRALRKLRKDAPELHAEVLNGNLSAHAAMVKAGFWPRKGTVRYDNPASTAKTLRTHMSPDDLRILARLLAEEV